MSQNQLRLCIGATLLLATCGLAPAATAFPADPMMATTNLAQPVQWPAYEYDRWGRPYYAPRERWREEHWRRERWLEQRRREEEARRRAEWRRRNEWQQHRHWDDDDEDNDY